MTTMNANEWCLTKLRKITIKIGSGATPRGGKKSYKKDGITLIRSLNVYDFNFEYDGLAFIDEDQAEKLSNVEIHSNDILLNITGASVARCCMVPAKLLPARVNQHVAIVRVNPTIADSGFILYCINSPQYKHHLLTLAQGGATREALTKDTIGDFEIALPPLTTQRKIAAILSAYDDLVENNTRRIKILEEMAQALYREWFVKFRFPGHEKVKMVESELGMVPEGWNSANLTEVTSYINRGITPKYDDQSDSLVINQRCIRNNKIDLKIARKHKKKVPKEKYVCFGDVLINSTGVGTLGRVAQLYENIEDCSVDTHVSIVRPSNEVDLDYFGLALQDLESYFESKGAGATGQTELRREIIGETPLIIPPENLQKQFGTLISPNRRKIIIILQQNEILSRTRNLLLPKLISGEVDVENIDVQMPNNGGA
jgi:type I restriction enzyme, S subunit